MIRLDATHDRGPERLAALMPAVVDKILERSLAAARPQVTDDANRLRLNRDSRSRRAAARYASGLVCSK
ncbi:MAG: hypothetical protein HY290_26190 [Planctomycetia bacterium]|nr:hypothetical protein [Planctomycetia bacterium]